MRDNFCVRADWGGESEGGVQCDLVVVVDIWFSYREDIYFFCCLKADLEVYGRSVNIQIYYADSRGVGFFDVGGA